MGLFTRPKKILDPSLFENNKLIPDIRNSLLHIAYTTFPQEKIYGLFIIGTAVSHIWEGDGDIDINLILAESVKEDPVFWSQHAKETNGEILKGTLHPVNFFVQPFRVPRWENDAQGVYDLIQDEWVIAPPPPESIPNLKEQNSFDILTAQHWDTRIQSVISGLRRAHERYRFSKNPAWKAEMDRYLDDLLLIFKELDTDRKVQYDAGWGVPRYSGPNVIFKYIKESDFIDLMDSLKRIYSGSL